MNQQGQDPQMMKAQMEEQLRVITFIHGQKKQLMNANCGMINAIAASREDLATIFPSPVIIAYSSILDVQNTQLAWEVENLERDMTKIHEFLTQLASPILRVMPTPMPPPTGPRNIR